MSRNLMLKEEVAAAVEAGQFHIYPVGNIDEGLEVLTGLKAGERMEGDGFEADSINDRVQKRLETLAEKLRDFGKGEEKEKDASGGNGD